MLGKADLEKKRKPHPAQNQARMTLPSFQFILVQKMLKPTCCFEESTINHK